MALKGHKYACDKDGVTFKLKGGKTVPFPLIGKLCRQYGYRPGGKDRVISTACAVISPGQAKAPTNPTDINTFYCTYGHTYKVLFKKTAEQQGVNLSGEPHECRGCSMAKGPRKPIARSTHTRAGTLCPFRAPAATAPYCRRGRVYKGEGASGEGASNPGGGRMEGLDSKFDLDNMTEVWPPVPPAPREAPATEPGSGVAGVWKATPRHHRSPTGWPISVASTAAVAAAAVMTAAPAVTAVTATIAGTFPRSWGDLRVNWRFSSSSPN